MHKHYLVPSLIWALVIFVLSNQPNLKIVENNNVDEPLRSGAHAFIFCILIIFFLWGIYRGNIDRQWYRWGIVLAIAYALFDEYHQSLVPSRSGNFGDICLDIGGITIGGVVFFIWKKKFSGHGKRDKNIRQ